jgi:hypothetical protein
MTIQHWKLSLLKGGKRIALFVTTTDRMVERDLAGDMEKSIIAATRQYHRRGQTPEQDHRDLAIGVFMAYAAAPAYDLNHEHVESVSAVPEGLPTGYIGGDGKLPLVPIWEGLDPDPCS